MTTTYQPLLPDAFIASRWANEYKRFRSSHAEAELIQRLQAWAAKKPQKETTAEGAFVDIFFKHTWNYNASGENTEIKGYTCEPKYAVENAGQKGGTGSADLALGYFDHPTVASTPQVLCEFKDVRSDLDKPQKRKGNERSPVKQCADYLKAAAGTMYGNELVQPTWGIVSDMNEFRLYWRKNMPSQYQRFVLTPTLGDSAVSLLSDTEESAFQRFVFWKIFQRESLLTTGGPSLLEKLLTDQWIQERVIESDFYREYHHFRQEAFTAIVDVNPDFKGTPGKLVRLTQRFLDRCIFVLFCEDMGDALNFPKNILRDILTGVSMDPDYDPADDAAWIRLKKLFAAMRDGSPFREHRINRFNGGLFAPEPELESLHIPSRIFCVKKQGSSPETLTSFKKTLLFFSANYNFGVSGGTFERSIGLYTLGHIFEQSITELELLEAKADGRASITELSKRKRDGVYYTPEWITSYLVEETIGASLSEIRKRLELDPLPTFSDDELSHYRRARVFGKKDKRFKKTERVEKYLTNLDRFSGELDNFKVVDPACGSGAFLIQALDRLVNERRWLAAERERVTGTVTLFDTDAVTKAVLSNNLYGVDINEESVEITRLALWLHTALPDRPLTSLDHNIRCGNSLVDQSFYTYKQESIFGISERERINAFDWKSAFPEVFERRKGRSGFDCVIGNPPYVKLQHFRQVLPAVAEYLLEARRRDRAGPLYTTTQTKNFDMYLPFIERGVELLNESGRMGFIAPSLWLINEHGEGLRNYILETRCLDRWVDFKDFPVFDEAMTYTSLQFYRGKPCASVSCMFAPDGEIGGLDWDNPDTIIPYNQLPADDSWTFLPEKERDFLNRLAANTKRLDELSSVSSIFQGVITSADHIYHLERISLGCYRHFPKNKTPIDVEIEDAIMRPLVSGEEAKRYQEISTGTYILFPYDDKPDRPSLYKAKDIASRFPKAWSYLCGHEAELRQRENGAFDDDQWFRFGRNQSIDKQKLPKLGVAQTAPEMRVFYDETGTYCFNNVRVNGIVCDRSESAYFLMGILNSRVVDFVVRRRSKPKEPRPSGSYFEANKQFIAPLPIPSASDAECKKVIQLSRKLRKNHTSRRQIITAINQRLASTQFTDSPREPKWLWADVGDVLQFSTSNADNLKGRALTVWAKAEHEKRIMDHLVEIDGAISFGNTMCADERHGELRFFVGSRCIVSGVYVDKNEVPVILAQWRQIARGTFVSESVKAKKIIDRLLDLRKTDNRALVEQLDDLNRRLESVEAEIRNDELELDEFLYQLYALTNEERFMVEADTRHRWENRIPRPPT